MNALGARFALTAGRSLAVDKRVPCLWNTIWIDAQLPIESEKPETKFRRLLFAQDTGSAIVGPARADIYFGHGEEISHIAGRIKQNGQFVMLVPQNVPVNRQPVVAGAKNIPLPKPRPRTDRHRCCANEHAGAGNSSPTRRRARR